MRRDHWKQDTPKMQAVGILSGIQGWLLNLEHGHSSPARVLQGVQPLVEELQALFSEEMPEAWGLVERLQARIAELEGQTDYACIVPGVDFRVDDDGDYLDRKLSR